MPPLASEESNDMKIQQRLFEQDHWSITHDDGITSPHLVLFFAGASLCKTTDPWHLLKNDFPDTPVIGASTGGEILADEVLDDSISAVAIEFSLPDSQIRFSSTDIHHVGQSADCGRELITHLPTEQLKLVWLLSDGLNVNGSELIRGCRQELPENILITGGLAGDGSDFQQTFLSADAPIKSQQIIAIGFYGESLNVDYGSAGGWDHFGPERLITRSDGNILHELDNQPALDLYKRYLGDEADHLPGSALLFPLAIRSHDKTQSTTVRTVLAVDETQKSMTFAGNIPTGHVAQLMRGNFDHLVEGAASAARNASPPDQPRSLALLVSCIGRKLLMGQRVADEVEVIADIMGPHTCLSGFYSYGEIAPDSFYGHCELHNQTMTITLISEQQDA